MRGIGAALLIGTLLVTAGCGGDDKPEAKKPAASTSTSAGDGVRPSVKELAEALRGVKDAAAGSTYNATQATCIAEILESSQVSDAGLREVLGDPGEFNPQGDDATAVRGLIPKISACLIDELRTPSPTS